MKNSLSQQSKQSQHPLGFSLIELMVAMALGLFLMAGVMQLLFSSTQAYTLVSSQSQVKDTGRFGLYFLAKSIRHAGYWPSLDAPKTYGEDSTFTGENSVIFGINGNEKAPDAIWLRTIGSSDGSIKTCLGAILTETQVAVDNYFILGATDPDGIASLACRSTIYAIDMGTLVISEVAVVPSVTRTLVNGVENMQILYGIGDTDTDGVTRYMRATKVEQKKAWANVQSIKIALLSAADDDSAGMENTQTYNLLDKTINSSGDSRPRVVYQQTISLRNFILN